MTSGGARVRSGPPPDPNALRRDRDKGDWVHLPAAGRDGESPAWPLSRATRRELELWDAEWRRPQAIQWEANGQAVEVALYVRALKDAEMPRAPVAARTLVRQLMDALGLTVPGLLKNRWVIDSEEPVSDDRPARRAASSSSAKGRLRALQGGAAAS